MKWIKFIYFLLILFVMLGNSMEVYAQNLTDNCNVMQLRAGGGGGGGSGGSGGGTGGNGSGRLHGRGGGFVCNHHNVILCVFDYVAIVIIFFATASISAIVLYFKIIRSSINSRKYMRLISKNDFLWKYKNIEKQVIDTYYIVQNAWTNMNMEMAKDYMDDDLYELFRQKIDWMEIGNKRNVLKKIKLINLKPVSVIDDEDNSKDLIWFYIKGSMVDYTINTKTNEIIDGNNSIFGISFIEYWKFVRKNDKWVLSKILQVDEKDKIIFQ